MEPSRRILALLASMTPPGLLGARGSAQQTSGEGFLPYLFVAFTIVWLVFFGYVLYLSRRQADLSRDIENLRRSRTQREPTPQQGTPSRRE